jgi:hypothetical protein
MFFLQLFKRLMVVCHWLFKQTTSSIKIFVFEHTLIHNALFYHLRNSRLLQLLLWTKLVSKSGTVSTLHATTASWWPKPGGFIRLPAINICIRVGCNMNMKKYITGLSTVRSI